MSDILKRDITGECEGECRDRVGEGEIQRQRDIETSGVESLEPLASATWTKSRNEQPGVWGGHV